VVERDAKALVRVCLALPRVSIGAELLARYKSNLKKREMKKKMLACDDVRTPFFGIFTTRSRELAVVVGVQS
jgi:hypothetical protein